MIMTEIEKNYDYSISKKECDNCNSSNSVNVINNLRELDGHLVCVNCGLIASHTIIEDIEWTNYNDGSLDKSRCEKSYENELNPFINSLITFIPRGSTTTVYKNGEKYKFDISKLHLNYSYNHMQRSYNNVENLIEGMTTNKYSYNVCMTTKTLWAEIMKSKKITRAGVRKGLIACCLYYACINHDTPRSPLEICRDFGMDDTKHFNKGDKDFKEMFGNNIKWSHLLTKTLQSDDYFSRFCNKLENEEIIGENMSFIISKKCRVINDQVADQLSCFFPKSAAAGIIYYVCKQEGISILMNKMAKSLDVCPPTLSKVEKFVEKLLKN